MIPCASMTTIASGTVSRIECSRSSPSRRANSAALRSVMSRMIPTKIGSSPSRASREFLVGHLVEIAAGQHIICHHTDLAADLARDDVVVTGQDLYLDARARQRCDRDPGAFLGRVEKGDITQER